MRHSANARFVAGCKYSPSGHVVADLKWFAFLSCATRLHSCRDREQRPGLQGSCDNGKFASASSASLSAELRFRKRQCMASPHFLFFLQTSGFELGHAVLQIAECPGFAHDVPVSKYVSTLFTKHPTPPTGKPQTLPPNGFTIAPSFFQVVVEDPAALSHSADVVTRAPAGQSAPGADSS